VTQDIHKKLEQQISDFHGTEDTILYPSCFDANAGVCVRESVCVCVRECVCVCVHSSCLHVNAGVFVCVREYVCVCEIIIHPHFLCVCV
jgi:7-keto-8-aminopelargonate synthetase-like enzyme